ncbi:glycosyltransferase [Pollutibacter soli]|uniref:glycosyltransferase n=1 Tax=Pollutibacter soli TaxID=3034157 RepID=UPI003013F68C
MKIALLTLGTRGDIQPFAILGKALKSRGHEVVIATAKNFSSLIESYNIDFVPVEADFQAILNSEEGKKMMSNPLSARKHLHRLIYPMMISALETFYSISRESDCVLFHVKAMAEYFMDNCNAKFIKTNVVPAIEPTSEFGNPVFSSWHLPRFLNRSSYKLTDLGLKMMNKPINEFRKKIGITTKFKKPPLPSIYGISPHFLTQPNDYPNSSYFSGFWFDEEEQEPDQKTLDFIHGGTVPLAFTLGSMPFETKINVYDALNSLSSKYRLIIIKGWGLQKAESFNKNKNIHLVESAPYQKLFPLVKGVIHHGGIGTIAACLRAGTPFFTCPVLYPLGDQHFWGTIAYQKNLACKPVPAKKLTLTDLLSAADRLVNDSSLQAHAQLMQTKLNTENGVQNAIHIIEKLGSGQAVSR